MLRTIDRNTLKSLDLHLVIDNYATHKHPKVKAWLKHHPRFHLHFTPTSASWINLVEHFFGPITEDAIRRGVFHSVAELEAAIQMELSILSAPFTEFELRQLTAFRKELDDECEASVMSPERSSQARFPSKSTP